jgi:hypothetical protein
MCISSNMACLSPMDVKSHLPSLLGPPAFLSFNNSPLFLTLLVVLLVPSLRGHLFELFLRLHQRLAIMSAASAIYRIFSISVFMSTLYISLKVPIAFVYLYGRSIYCTAPTSTGNRDRAERSSTDTLQVTLYLLRPVRVNGAIALRTGNIQRQQQSTRARTTESSHVATWLEIDGDSSGRWTWCLR